LEDRPEHISAELLEAELGPRVREMVEACTDTPVDFDGGEKPPSDKRKKEYIARIRSGRHAAIRVTLADKLHNARAIRRDRRKEGEAIWTRFSQSKEATLGYYRELAEAFREVGATGFMIDELERVVTELETGATAPEQKSPAAAPG